MLFVTLTLNVSTLRRRSFANKAILRHYPLANQRFLRSVVSSSKPGSKTGRPRIEQESFRTGNDFRSDLLKNSRYSDCVSVSLQPCNVANLESLLRDKLAKAELKSKNFTETIKLRGLIGVWEELTATYICNDGKERIKSSLTFKEAFETSKGYDPQYHAETSGQYDDEYFQRALLHPQYGLCVIIATLVIGHWSLRQ